MMIRQKQQTNNLSHNTDRMQNRTEMRSAFMNNPESLSFLLFLIKKV